MYIEPNTNIYILKNVPLDTTYDHTIYFANKEAQVNYFVSKRKYNLSNYSYLRTGRGVARVGINAERLYDCNYLMFQNTSFGNKWFYAYIKRVEYVNNEMSEIYFDIDVMQTWWFDFTIDECFVEREHSVTDAIGEHIEPESVATGESVYNSYAKLVDLSEMCVIMAVVDVDEPNGELHDGVYSGATLYAFPMNNLALIDLKLAEYKQKPDAVVGMYMLPRAFLPAGYEFENIRLPQSTRGVRSRITVDGVGVNTSVDGYIPKNKKLLTYPYNYYQVNNGSGQSLTLRYEFFENLQPQLLMNSTVTSPVMANLTPINYKGIKFENYNADDSEAISLNNFPICSWNFDSYQAWVSQNSVPMIIKGGATAVAGAVGAVGGAMVAGPAGAVGGALVATKGIADLMSQQYTASIQADMVKGSANVGSVNASVGRHCFFGGRCSITKQYARMIDEYFTKFGYSVKRLKKPNTHSRRHWNYVKTIGATVTGSVPCDDMRKICSILDNGITFWKNGDEVGNYSLDNTV